MATWMLRYEPGADSSANGIQVRDFWDELFILQGPCTDLSLQLVFTAGMYACRAPGMPHGPWRSDEGVASFEVDYRA